MDWSAALHPYAATGFLTSLITLAVGCFVFVQNRKSSIHLSFLIFSIAIAEWSFFTALQALPRNPAWSFLAAKICQIGAMLIPVFFHYFTLKIIGRDQKPILRLGFLLASINIFAIFFSPLFSAGTRSIGGINFYYKAGPLYILCVIFFVSYVLFAIYQLWDEIHSSQGARKKHLEYLFFASLAGYGIGVVNFFPVYGIIVPPFPFSPICGAIYSCVIAYAILKHQLFDIEVILKKTVIFAVLFIAIYSAVSAAVYFATAFFASKNVPLLSGISIALAMLLYEPLKKTLTAVTNRALFQKKIPYSVLVQNLTDRLAKIHEAGALAHEIVDFLTQQMGLDWAGLYLKTADGLHFRLASSELKALVTEFGMESPVVRAAAEGAKPLILSPFDTEADQALEKESLRKLKVEALVPVLVEGKLDGILLLGKKLSDDVFTAEDAALLETLMEELGMFFLSARLLKEATRTHLELGQRQKMAAVSKLARGVHHEVRNPLHTINLFALATLHNLEIGRWHPASREEFSQDIVYRSRTMLEEIERIKNSLSRFAQFARPQQELDCSPIRIKEASERFLALMREAHKMDGIQVRLKIPETLSLLAHEGVLQEIFFNLFTNAYEAMQGKGEIIVEALETSDACEIVFSDSGPGIPREILSRIFEPYFTTKTRSEAAGIGLSVVRHYMEILNGDIQAEACGPLGGASFRLRFQKASQVAGKKAA
ncbi:MAG: GAF domain-containing protein [Candidatus Omnitrophica bacterium]|nr:GAF domain-containing protein [Candidatus Omnitrophota bacterium]